MRLGVRFLASLRASRIQGYVAVSCGIGRRCGLDLVLLWLWLAAVASIRPLAWEPPYAVGVALKKPFYKLYHTESSSGPNGLGIIPPIQRS